jgi:hypothetical protein
VRGEVGNVAWLIERPTAAAGEVLQQYLALRLRREIGHGEIEAPLGECFSGGTADTPASAGDDGNRAAHDAANLVETM